jgi:uroporphyrinogen-III synthase
MGEPVLRGLTIGITAERAADAQAKLFSKRGAAVLHGPTVHIAPVSDDEVLREVTAEIIARPPDFLLASTGYGMRTWLAATEVWGLRLALLNALAQAKVANRGAKAGSANKAVGLREWYRAPTERIDELVKRVLMEPLAGSRVVLQRHAMPVPHAVLALRTAGAEVIEVDAYRSSLPVDRAPARVLIGAACAGEVAAVTFTTAPAVHNLFVLAQEERRTVELRQAFNEQLVAACVGPVCAEGALQEGIMAPLVPTRARLVPLVDALTRCLSGSHGTSEAGDEGVEKRPDRGQR